METRRTDLGGLATFWMEGSGPSMAWLVFRVGAMDETLFTRGITRFVAGLALDGVDNGRAAYGAFVGAPTTAFELNGTADEVRSILHHVWSALASTSVERLDHVREREILHSGWRRPDVIDHLLAQRFGPQGPGLAGQPDIGLHHLESQAVAEWRERYFVPANAALALKNLRPEDVSLPSRDLGAWQPPPPPSPRPLTLPAWVEHHVEEVSVASVQPATDAVDAFTAAAVRRTRRRLAGDEGQRVRLAPLRLWPSREHLSIHCDAPDRSGERVRDALLDVLDELASRGPDETEIAERHRELREPSADVESALARLEWAPHRHVLDPSDDDAGARTPPTVPEVVAAARDFLATAIYSLPPRVGMPITYHHLSGSSDDAVAGTTYERAGDPRAGNLVVGVDGVTMTLDDRRVTVRFDGYEAVAQWPDGTLDLYGSDGFGMQVRPKEWVEGASAVAAIAQRVPERLVVMRRPLPGA